MTVNYHYQARTKYHCDICGKDEFWNSDWMRYSSMAHDETCPDDVPCACSTECKEELMKRIEDGRIQLPKLRLTPGYFEVSKKRKGY